MNFKLGLVLFCTPVGAWAQSAVHCGKLLDVKKGTYSTDVIILTDGEKIIDVGPAGRVSVPSGVPRIEVPGTCLPGLIDVHDHLTRDPSHSGYQSWGFRSRSAPSPAPRMPRGRFGRVSPPCAMSGAAGICRRRAARRDRCGRNRWSAAAGFRPGAGHHGRPLR